MAFIGSSISGSLAGAAVLYMTGTVNLVNDAVGPGELRFIEDTDNGVLYTGFKAGNVTENSVYTMPVAYPASNKVLQSTDAGVMTWETAGGGVTALNNATANELVTVGSTTTELDAESGLTFASDILTLTADASALKFGAGNDVTFTHDNGTGMNVASAGDFDIAVSAGNGTFTVADTKTLILGQTGASELKLSPHSTAGSELASLINTAGTTDGSDAAGSILLSAVAGGIGLAWADGKDLWAEGGSMMFVANEDKASCIQLHADAGTSQTITIVNDAGTSATEGSAAIQLLASAGGVNIKSALNNANAILLTADGGADETIVIHTDQGTGEGNGNASIELVSDAGGICLTATGLTGVMTNGNSDAAVQLHAGGGGIGIRSAANLEGCIQIEADGGANETISIHSDQGTGVNTAGSSTDASINLISDVGGIGLYSAINADNAITLEANGGANETIQIRSNQGTGVATANIANAVNASIAIVSDDGGISMVSGLNADSSIWIGADGGDDETIVIHSHQGTGDDSITLKSDEGGITVNLASGKAVIPAADNANDLGTAAARWRNIYTTDLHLNNTRGNWTIVEEADMLTIRNNITGKWYKMGMTEIDPTGRDEGMASPPTS